MSVSVLEREASRLTETRPLAELAPELPARREAVKENLFRTPVDAALPTRPRRTLFSSLRQTSARPKAPLQDPDAGPKSGERRRFQRCRGRQVKVLLADGEVERVLFQGWVFDRSQGGLGLCVPQRLEKGAEITVRAITEGKSEWIRLEVRNCRRCEGGWIVGCRFARLLRWEVMLQFC